MPFEGIEVPFKCPLSVLQVPFESKGPAILLKMNSLMVYKVFLKPFCKGYFIYHLLLTYLEKSCVNVTTLCKVSEN